MTDLRSMQNHIISLSVMRQVQLLFRQVLINISIQELCTMKMNQVVLQLIKQLMGIQILLGIMEHLHLIYRRSKHQQYRAEKWYIHRRLVELINMQIPV